MDTPISRVKTERSGPANDCRETATCIDLENGRYNISVRWNDGSGHVEQFQDVEQARNAWATWVAQADQDSRLSISRNFYDDDPAPETAGG